MKYALFAGYDYYPSGGARDFVSWYQTITGAKVAFRFKGTRDWGRYEWAQVADEDMNVVDEYAGCWGPTGYSGWFSGMSDEDREWWQKHRGDL